MSERGFIEFFSRLCKTLKQRHGMDHNAKRQAFLFAKNESTFPDHCVENLHCPWHFRIQVAIPRSPTRQCAKVRNCRSYGTTKFISEGTIDYWSCPLLPDAVLFFPSVSQVNTFEAVIYVRDLSRFDLSGSNCAGDKWSFWSQLGTTDPFTILQIIALFRESLTRVQLLIWEHFKEHRLISPLSSADLLLVSLFPMTWSCFDSIFMQFQQSREKQDASKNVRYITTKEEENPCSLSTLKEPCFNPERTLFFVSLPTNTARDFDCSLKLSKKKGRSFQSLGRRIQRLAFLETGINSETTARDSRSGRLVIAW